MHMFNFYPVAQQYLRVSKFDHSNMRDSIMITSHQPVTEGSDTQFADANIANIIILVINVHHHHILPLSIFL